MVNPVARGVTLSSIDSTTLHSVTGVPDPISVASVLVVAPLHVLLDDDLLPNRSCRGERGVGGK